MSNSAPPLNGVRQLLSITVKTEPRCLFYVVAVVCFGPVVLVALLGVTMIPVWIGMLAEQIAEPERFRVEDRGIWDDVWPIVLVASGLVGFIGLIRFFGLLHGHPTAMSRRVTLAMVAIGLLALLVFDLLVVVPGLFSMPIDEWPITGLAIYVVLPLLGTAWLLLAARKALSG